MGWENAADRAGDRDLYGLVTDVAVIHIHCG